MAPFYKHVCEELKWDIDAKRLQSMEAENKKSIDDLDEKIKDAEENLGEIEIRDAHLNKAEYYVRIGDKVYAMCYIIFYSLYTLSETKLLAIT